MSCKQTVVHWFRKGLRVHDNPALVRAVNEAIAKKISIRPIFILDPLIIKWYVLLLLVFLIKIFIRMHYYILGFVLGPIAGGFFRKH